MYNERDLPHIVRSLPLPSRVETGMSAVEALRLIDAGLMTSSESEHNNLITIAQETQMDCYYLYGENRLELKL